jgi:polyhydroxyalkanoate synthesis regulator phasin
MPAPKKRTSGDDEDSVAEQLRRYLDPREVVVVTRDRMQEALDDAVERGRMTRDDATDLLGELFRRGRKQTDDLISDLEALLAGTRRPADRVLREVRRATGLGPPFPITGYDDLTAAQVTERLGGLSPAELRKVRDHEKRNANRKSVLAAVERKLG